MNKSLIGLLALAGALLSSQAAAWWNADWSYRKAVAIDTTLQGANLPQALGRTPVLLRLHTGNFNFDGIADDGRDIRLVAADDKTVLNYQIEHFDPLLGVAYLWVDLPDVAGGQRRDLWLYYGNPKAPATSSGKQVFDADYTLVYHFDEADGAPRDATGYGHAGQGVPAGRIDGVIAKAALFGGQRVTVPATAALATSAGGSFSFSSWVRREEASGNQLIYARRAANQSLLIGLREGKPYVSVNGSEASAGQPLAAGQWQHLAVTAGNGQLTLYVAGKPAAQLAAALPALNGPAALGGDIDEAGANFRGALDEVRLSRVTRPALAIQADALAQGAESKFVSYGVDEQASGVGFGPFGFIFKSVPVDAWIIIAILALMAVHSWYVMVQKNRYVGRLNRANLAFRERFAQIGTRLELLADEAGAAATHGEASLWRLYEVAIKEIRARRNQGADTRVISTATIEAIRVSMDAARTRENLKLGSNLGGLSNAIAGGPYIGLLGTVIGIMLVFAQAAMAGDVNINAVAPGMAAALLATAMGLFVAIPALFGYNHLVNRNKGAIADMRVFVDEFVSRLAELHGDDGPAYAPPPAQHGAGAAVGSPMPKSRPQPVM
ncbi:DUF2341 domain-containing protein [Chitinolyticbacter meiyuanensis]|uniref:DUF2341 domain-containing protein n=1 Tax=Chitinolyticbacter meiyuanensis TaxID=682798 RepID=UPI0011E5F41F|nr:DUF2341 domain-containing protein [Chitinolyticbacter meiyuanensis]